MYSGASQVFFRLCDSDFGITPVDDIAIGITWTAFCFHIAHISFASSWYLFCLSVIIIIIIIIIIITALFAWTFYFQYLFLFAQQFHNFSYFLPAVFSHFV